MRSECKLFNDCYDREPDNQNTIDGEYEIDFCWIGSVPLCVRHTQTALATTPIEMSRDIGGINWNSTNFEVGVGQ